MNQKLTDKQKAALWSQYHNANFQASNRLEGHETEAIDLSPAVAAERLQTLRRHYER
ncbi:DUF2559 family protein [Erwiniaceae bacterium BAC15a-03b]|uniref:DUF2559 family protein n=1 Tax=Winslowiella arboricola TaxID=2978220 RepID=A0A9J6PJD0_9GAMM|nr:YhfG family protein [Winslowiella arboricola]MCU5771844.1 DUF2559 family protein [Winslowiella arboricola]MCU5777474.1 DUF2559 family protein [Winslowiella arboricola]